LTASGTVTVHAPEEARAALKRTGVPVRIATRDSGNIRGTLVAR
jgi:hypothetical protein